MPTVRYLVHDVDAVLPFYEALGFRQVDRWGPPFAILERQGLARWLSAPGTSAARPMPDGAKPAPGGWSRIVIEVDDLDDALEWAAVCPSAEYASVEVRPLMPASPAM